MNPVWAQGPRELLDHAYGHLSIGEGFDCRIAFISVDNAVEVMIKTYLSFGDKKSELSNSPGNDSKLDKFVTFPKLLEMLQKVAADKIVGLNLEEIQHFHGIRNHLYHTFGLSVESSVVEAYAQIAKALYENLFESSLKITQSDKMGDTSRFILRWNALQEMLTAKLPTAGKSDPNAFGKFFGQINPELSTLYEHVRRFRNSLVHGKLSENPDEISKQLQNIERLLNAGENDEPPIKQAGPDSGKKTWTSQLNLDELRLQAKEFLEGKLQKTLKQFKPSLFETNDGQIGIGYFASKAYAGGKRVQFWFGLHDAQMEFLNAHPDGLVTFVCAGHGLLLAPWNEFQRYVDDLGETSTDTGHWRHVILHLKDSSVQLKLRGSGPNCRIDVSKWFIKKWPLVAK